VKFSLLKSLCACLLLFGPAACAGPTEPPLITLQQIAAGLEHPTFFMTDHAGRMFVVEQHGRIRIIKNGVPDSKPYFLDIQKQVFDQGECGLLSMAFHPNFKTNGLFYVNYTGRKRGLRTFISEFHVDPQSDHCDASTERVILTIDQPYANHNGGQIAFGPDGKLYIGMGDGGSHDDPKNAGQDPGSLLGKMLRIDVDQREQAAYGIPADNPMVDLAGARSEIFATGLRNPWRFSFDALTGELWAGDVGQNNWEEIDIVKKGGNYGWRPREGFHQNPQRSTESVAGQAIDPVWEYPHEDRNVSITGGHVYRGDAMPAWRGWYFYGDYASGRIWALKYVDGKAVQNSVVYHDWALTPSSFGEDGHHELYICAHERGMIFRLAAK
jgi:glucose/arabinose dehydrogenase